MYTDKWKIVLNDLKYGLNNIVEAAPCKNDGLPICQDFSVTINFDSPEELNEWVEDETDLNVENGDYHIEGHYLPE